MTIDDYVTQLEQLDFMGVIETGTGQVPDLLNAATELFERFDPGDQLIALSLMAGLVIESCNVGSCDFEVQNQTLLSADDRVRVMITMVRTAIKEAGAVASRFDPKVS